MWLVFGERAHPGIVGGHEVIWELVGAVDDAGTAEEACRHAADGEPGRYVAVEAEPVVVS